MKALCLPPGTYLVGDPASLVSSEVWETIRESFQSLNPGGSYSCPRVVCDGHHIVLIPTKKYQVWLEATWCIPARSGFIAVMPMELVTADVAILTSPSDDTESRGETNFTSVSAVETATIKFLIIEVSSNYFVVGEQEFDLTLQEMG